MKKESVEKNVGQLWVRLAELRNEIRAREELKLEEGSTMKQMEKMVIGITVNADDKLNALGDVRKALEKYRKTDIQVIVKDGLTGPRAWENVCNEKVNTKIKFDGDENYIPVKPPFNAIKARCEIAEKLYGRIIKSNAPDTSEVEAFLKLIS